MSAPLSPAAADLKFQRREYGGQQATITATREAYRSSDGETVINTTDSVVFRAVPTERYDQDKRRIVRTGWRCIVFANGAVVFDDLGRECVRLAEAKAYLRRMADDPRIAHHTLLALCGEEFSKQTRLDHASAMAALDDFYSR